MKVLIGINNLTAVAQPIYGNHVQFFYRIVKQFPDIEVALCNPPRMTIDTFRNFAAKAALEIEADYLMFIDDDILIPLDAFKQLHAANKDIIAGWTVIRGYPYDNMIFKHNKNKAKLEYLNKFSKRDFDKNGLLKVDAVGCSCVLIKTSVLKQIEPPYFVTGTHHTEDIYFCMKAKEKIKKLQIYVDPRVVTGHLLHQEALTPGNRLIMKKLHEDLNGVSVDPSGDRGARYVKSILKPKASNKK